jgi:hypothetical protein
LVAACRPSKAREIFVQLAHDHPGTYYGVLAKARTQGKRTTDHLFRMNAVTHNDDAFTLKSSGLSGRSAELLHLGLWDHAIAEVDHAAGSTPPFQPVHRFAVAQLANEWGLDPDLVMHQMWQESARQAQVVSPAGAIGLMQLMPSTAERLAKELKMKDYRVGDLFQPLPNIQLGMWYMRQLFDRYDGTIPYVLASYNAGEEAVDRWRRKRPDHDIEEYIEAIPYSETRNYVKRIMQFYW